MEKQKCCVGIDMSKDDFTACIATRKGASDYTYSSVEKFVNEKRGFNQLLRWVRKTCSSNSELVFLMEATGVYHESLAYHLHHLKQTVHIVLPNSIKHYGISLGIKSKTDPIDAKLLARLGVERTHREWIPAGECYRKLRQLTRHVSRLQHQRTHTDNILHSIEAGYDAEASVRKSIKKVLRTIDQAIEKGKEEIAHLVKESEELKSGLALITSIPGIGEYSAAVIVAETQGFEHMHSIKQLTSYAGYDVVQRESGTSVKGKTRISKKGNSHLRSALFFPAMVACRYNPTMKALYERISTKNSSKMVGQVAVQRKLLALSYTLWKNKKSYDPEHKKAAPTMTVEAALDRQ